MLILRTGEKKYINYVKERHQFIAHWAGVFREKIAKGELRLNGDFALRQPVAPHALDDGGCCSRIDDQSRNARDCNRTRQPDLNFIWIMFP